MNDVFICIDRVNGLVNNNNNKLKCIFTIHVIYLFYAAFSLHKKNYDFSPCKILFNVSAIY